MALSLDGSTAITVRGSTATLWELGAAQPRATVTLQVGQPVSALAFAPGPGLVLAAGHVDGTLTAHTINSNTGYATTLATVRSGGWVDGPVARVRAPSMSGIATRHRAVAIAAATATRYTARIENSSIAAAPANGPRNSPMRCDPPNVDSATVRVPDGTTSMM